MWALADPELNGWGSAGTVGEAWPHLQQVCRLERQRVVKGKKQVAVSYAISSLPATGRCQAIVEVGTGARTASRVRDALRRGPLSTCALGPPHSLRNLVISLVRRAGHSNVAAALRRHNAHLSEAFDMMGFSYQAGE